MIVKLYRVITSYGDTSPDFCVTASISVLCTDKDSTEQVPLVQYI